MNQRICGLALSMLILLSALILMYVTQFKMQKTIIYFDNFEKYDCNIFDSSIALNSGNKN